MKGALRGRQASGWYAAAPHVRREILLPFLVACHCLSPCFLRDASSLLQNQCARARLGWVGSVPLELRRFLHPTREIPEARGGDREDQSIRGHRLVQTASRPKHVINQVEEKIGSQGTKA